MREKNGDKRFTNWKQSGITVLNFLTPFSLLKHVLLYILSRTVIAYAMNVK